MTPDGAATATKRQPSGKYHPFRPRQLIDKISTLTSLIYHSRPPPSDLLDKIPVASPVGPYYSGLDS